MDAANVHARGYMHPRVRRMCSTAPPDFPDPVANHRSSTRFTIFPIYRWEADPFEIVLRCKWKSGEAPNSLDARKSLDARADASHAIRSSQVCPESLLFRRPHVFALMSNRCQFTLLLFKSFSPGALRHGNLFLGPLSLFLISSLSMRPCCSCGSNCVDVL